MGISENVGHDVTFKILNSSTNKIINVSNVRPANDNASPNLRSDRVTSPGSIKLLRKDNFEAKGDKHCVYRFVVMRNHDIFFRLPVRSLYFSLCYLSVLALARA